MGCRYCIVLTAPSSTERTLGSPSLTGAVSQSRGTLGAFMKKVKYSPVGTEAKELNEYANQCKDEHEISINLAIERYGLGKELFYTEEQKRAAAEFASELERNDMCKNILEGLALFGGKPTGILKVAYEKGAQHQKSEFARKNAKIGAGKRPATIALKEIEEKEYPKHKHLFHLTGRIEEFVTSMHQKYPDIKNSGSIRKRVTKLNKANGIKAKTK